MVAYTVDLVEELSTGDVSNFELVGLNIPVRMFLIKSNQEVELTRSVSDFRIVRETEKAVDIAELFLSSNVGIEIGDEIVLTDVSKNKIFGGYVEGVEKKDRVKVIVYSYGKELLTTYVFNSWSNQRLKTIVESIVSETNLSIGYVEDLDITLERWISRESAIENLQKLALASNCSIRVDSDKNFYFEEKGVTYWNTTITRDNSVFLNVEKDTSQMANDILVKGGELRQINSESFTGDGVTKEFTLTYKPLSVKVTVDGSLLSRDSYSVIEEQKKVILNTAPASGSSIVIEYEYFYPQTVRFRSWESINKYGKYFRVLEVKWLKEYTDLVSYGKAYLSEYSRPFFRVRIKRKFDANEIMNVRPGMVVRVIDSVYGIDENMIVQKQEIKVDGIEYVLGSYVSNAVLVQAETINRIKELERRLSSEEVITEFSSIGSSVGVDLTTYSVGNATVTWQDTFILGTGNDIDTTALSGYQ